MRIFKFKRVPVEGNFGIRQYSLRSECRNDVREFITSADTSDCKHPMMAGILKGKVLFTLSATSVDNEKLYSLSMFMDGMAPVCRVYATLEYTNGHIISHDMLVEDLWSELAAKVS